MCYKINNLHKMSWNSRTELLLGSEGIKKLEYSHVLIAGLGGVGGYAAEQLTRAGVGRLSIVDADSINETNINRQIIALHSNIGEYKTIELKKRLLQINPKLELECITDFLKDEKTHEVLLKYKYDFVIDAIDTLSPKINFIRICYENKIPFISSMGAGGKINPSLVAVADISKTYNCNLARILRKRLHRIGIRKGFKAVFSSEKIDSSAVIEEESMNKKSNIGTISYMPALFGIYCASVAIDKILNYK